MRLLFSLALSLWAVSGAAQQSVEYRLTFFGDWVASDSSSYPASAHFTDLVGATHSPGNAIWKRGQLASQGVEDVAELGVTFALESELSAAAQAGTTGGIITLSSLFNLPNSTTRTINVRLDKPNITLISMLAPSSDWFVGVSDLSLLSNGRWRQSFSVDLHPYDAGTEQGSTFTLSNSATSPPQPIALIGASPFFASKPVVARLKFDLLTPLDPIPPVAPSQAAIAAPVIQLLLGD